MSKIAKSFEKIKFKIRLVSANGIWSDKLLVFIQKTLSKKGLFGGEEVRR